MALGTIRGVLSYLFALVISGLVIGALGRLAIPGRNPMGIGMTILVGIGGSLIGQHNKCPDPREGATAFVEKRKPRWAPYSE